MAKLFSPWHSTGGNQIAENSLDVTSGDLVAIKSWFVTLAVAGDTIAGVSLETKVASATNETVLQEEVLYASLADNTIVKIDVSNGTIAQANVGSTYDLTSAGVVDWATAWTGTSLKLKEVVTSAIGLFTRAK